MSHDKQQLVLSPLSGSCMPGFEHQMISFCPFCLPREFTLVVIPAVCIPPQTDADTAWTELRGILLWHWTSYPDTALVVTGDFGKTDHKNVQPDWWDSGQFCVLHSVRVTRLILSHHLASQINAAIFIKPGYKQMWKMGVCGDGPGQALDCPI